MQALALPGNTTKTSACYLLGVFLGGKNGEDRICPRRTGLQRMSISIRIRMKKGSDEETEIHGQKSSNIKKVKYPLKNPSTSSVLYRSRLPETKLAYSPAIYTNLP